MDETAIYFEDYRMQTFYFEGKRHVIMKSTGFSSMRITACVIDKIDDIVIDDE